MAEIIALITQGLSNQDIADRVYLSINSIKSNIRTSCDEAPPRRPIP